MLLANHPSNIPAPKTPAQPHTHKHTSPYSANKHIHIPWRPWRASYIHPSMQPHASCTNSNGSSGGAPHTHTTSGLGRSAQHKKMVCQFCVLLHAADRSGVTSSHRESQSVRCSDDDNDHKKGKSIRPPHSQAAVWRAVIPKSAPSPSSSGRSHTPAHAIKLLCFKNLLFFRTSSVS
jgi:hypothetical protein